MHSTPPRSLHTTAKSTEAYANPFAVRLPLLRVAHPTDDDKNREVENVRKELEKSRSKNLIESQDSDDLDRNISMKGVPAAKPSSSGQTPFQQNHNPLLFNFEHYYDPALTPRKGWIQKVSHLEALFEQEKEKLILSRTEAAQIKVELERQLLVLSSKLKESDSKVYNL